MRIIDGEIGTVTCVADLLSFVNENSRLRLHNNVNDMSWYRGQGNFEWHLTPAVYRDGQFEHETIYVKEFERTVPDEFYGLSSFEKLVKMQHYGLPTRLLDVTSNPLVALYFACSSEIDSDGAFFYFSAPTFWEDNWAIELISDYIFEPITCIQDLLEREKRRFSSSHVQLEKNEDEHTLTHVLTVPAHVVIPRVSNPRLRQQRGGFLLFGMALDSITTSKNIGTYGNRYYHFKELPPEREHSLCPITKKLRIPLESKGNLLRELNLLGIDEGFLYPELEHQANAIKKKIAIDGCHY